MESLPCQTTSDDESRAQTRKFTDKNGIDRYTDNIIVEIYNAQVVGPLVHKTSDEIEAFYHSFSATWKYTSEINRRPGIA